MDFNGSVPLPIGPQVSHSTVLANSMIQIEADNIEVHDTTESGWPTIITMQSENHPVGVAVDYPGIWHSQDVGVEEVDLLIFYDDKEWYWRAVAAFTSKQNAIECGRYETDEYNGYELVPWTDDNRFEQMEELLEKNVTPITYRDDHFTHSAHAMQEANNIDTLKKMFRIEMLDTLMDRKNRVFNKIVPQEVRWKNKDTSLREIARNIEDDSPTVPQPSDEPYRVGDRVKVYCLDGSDSYYHGSVGMVTNILKDSIEEETERGLDSYRYRIEADGTKLDAQFPHQNLVPVS